MPYLLRLLTAITLLAAVSSGLARPDPVPDPMPDPMKAERKLFLEARKALHANQKTRFEQLAAQLQDYPLYSYLQFEELRNRLSRASEEEITRFLKTWADQPVSKRLRQSWLYNLAHHRRWELFLEHYEKSSSVSLQCYALRARLNTGDKQGIVEEIIPLWLVGKSQEKSCDPLFKYLYDGDHITDELLWQRIRLAMKNNQLSLAAYLARKLPAADEAWVKLWQKAHRNPSTTLKNSRLNMNKAIVREIILHALMRIARYDPAQAHNKWESIKSGYSFTADDRGTVERYIALSAAQQHLPEAHDWLLALPVEVQDQRIREWQIRAALANQDWPAVLGHISALPADELENDEWRYWHAVALERNGQHLLSINHYAWLARERSYYGFLAADYLHWPYEMGNRPLDYDADALEELRRVPGVVRAHELYRANMLSDARREWHYATRDMNDDELKRAAVLASQWGWNDRAILTVARTGDYSDLKLRFPLDHVTRVNHYAKDSRLDPGHVFAVIRQESAFNPGARSPAGAMGLMQLMPATGKITARKFNIPYSGTRSLFNADKNIHLGTTYLRQVMDRYGNNPVLATASYNAGPHRVQRWLPEDNTQDATIWVANIPYTETRHYVQRVLAYATIYDWRMERPITRLVERMPTVFSEPHYLKPITLKNKDNS